MWLASLGLVLGEWKGQGAFMARPVERLLWAWPVLVGWHGADLGGQWVISMEGR